VRRQGDALVRPHDAVTPTVSAEAESRPGRVPGPTGDERPIAGSYHLGRIVRHEASTRKGVTPPFEPMPATITTSASATATGWHRRQCDLVAASLLAVPRVKRPTHRRWA